MPLPHLLNYFRRANARKGSMARALARESKRSFWALADQGVVSVGNFALIILLGREISESDFGEFFVLFDLMIFLNGLQAAFIVYPLTVRCAAADGAVLGRTTTLSLLLTCAAWPLMGASLLITATVAEISPQIGIWAAIATLSWQVQETTRRSLMTHLRFGSAVLGDTISHLGKAVAVVLLARQNNLTLITLFQWMAATSALAALVQAIQVRLRPAKLLELRAFGNTCWGLGRWMLVGNLTNFVMGPLFTWNIKFWHGDAMVGIYGAVSNVLRFSNPLGISIASLITPHAARAFQSESIHHAKRSMLRYGGLGAVLLVPFLMAVFFFPRHAIALLYGWDKEAYFEWAVVAQIAAVAAGVTYLSIVTGAFLAGIERTKQATIGQMVYAGVAFLILAPLVAMWSLVGAAAGWLIATIFGFLTNLYYVQQATDDKSEPMPTIQAQPAP